MTLTKSEFMKLLGDRFEIDTDERTYHKSDWSECSLDDGPVWFKEKDIVRADKMSEELTNPYEENGCSSESARKIKEKDIFPKVFEIDAGIRLEVDKDGKIWYVRDGYDYPIPIDKATEAVEFAKKIQNQGGENG